MKLRDYVSLDFKQVLLNEIIDLDEKRKNISDKNILETIKILEKCLDDLLEERID